MYLILFIFFLLAVKRFHLFRLVVWGDGYLSVPGRPVSLDNGRARAYCACSRCGWGCSFFSIANHFSFPPPSLWDGWMDNVI